MVFRKGASSDYSKISLDDFSDDSDDGDDIVQQSIRTNQVRASDAGIEPCETVLHTYSSSSRERKLTNESLINLID
jgi:hypothetical protein